VAPEGTTEAEALSPESESESQPEHEPAHGSAPESTE
jgi:hypothetical protein